MLSVMVVDDDPAILEVTQLALERAHEISVFPVSLPERLLAVLQKSSFDVIVLDYDLPEINGIEFLKILRSKGDVTPVIIFTGVGREHAAIAALNNGANFFLQKGENTDMPFIELQRMIRHAVDQRFMGKAKGLTRKIVFDLINFSLDAEFAIDPDGNVLAWNRAIEQLTGVPSQTLADKGNFVYAEPFFGKRQKMLIDMVFFSEDSIRKARYMVISKEKNGSVVAVTRARKPDGTEWTLWMKATPLFDNRGEFVAAACIIRDVTSTFKDVSIEEEATNTIHPAPESTKSESDVSGSSFIDRILGKAMVQYKEGVNLYSRARNYRAAVEAFDRAIEIDPKLPHVWNDRGICLRALGEYDEALKSFLRAVELAPGNAEILYELGETLEQMGVLQMNNKYLEAAVETFKMVVNLLPNNMDSWNKIGICLKELSRSEESKFYFGRARDIKLWKKDTPVPRKRNDFL